MTFDILGFNIPDKMDLIRVKNNIIYYKNLNDQFDLQLDFVHTSSQQLDMLKNKLFDLVQTELLTNKEVNIIILEKSDFLQNNLLNILIEDLIDTYDIQVKLDMEYQVTDLLDLQSVQVKANLEHFTNIQLIIQKQLLIKITKISDISSLSQSEQIQYINDQLLSHSDQSNYLLVDFRNLSVVNAKKLLGKVLYFQTKHYTFLKNQQETLYDSQKRQNQALNIYSKQVLYNVVSAIIQQCFDVEQHIIRKIFGIQTELTIIQIILSQQQIEQIQKQGTIQSSVIFILINILPLIKNQIRDYQDILVEIEDFDVSFSLPLTPTLTENLSFTSNKLQQIKHNNLAIINKIKRLQIE